jgi:hypothetical protein
MTQVVSSQDKFEHAIAFLVLMLLGAGGWPGRGGRIAVGLSAYGLLIEICQHTLTTNRFGDPWDWVADRLGRDSWIGTPTHRPNGHAPTGRAKPPPTAAARRRADALPVVEQRRDARHDGPPQRIACSGKVR